MHGSAAPRQRTRTCALQALRCMCCVLGTAAVLPLIASAQQLDVQANLIHQVQGRMAG